MLTGQHVIDALFALKRKGGTSENLAEFYSCFKRNSDVKYEEEHYRKIQEIISGTFKDERNMAAEVQEWIKDSDGTFYIGEIARDLGITDRKDSKNLSKILTRMTADEETPIEKYGAKNGCYRRIISSERIMDLNNVDRTSIDVTLPLALHRKTIFFKKTIVCVAGVTGTGKTSFALNFLYENRGTAMKKWYFNQEMHEQALEFKLTHFLGLGVKDWDFTAVTDVKDWASSIRPDDINVIDYLEAPNSEFWKIGDSIRAVERKLRNGMALILLQRKSNAVWGEGAEFSARASSLYVNMSWGKMEVVKNRYREGDEFKGLDTRNFDIENGLIVAKSGWYGGEDDKGPHKRKSRDQKTTSPYGDDFVHED